MTQPTNPGPYEAASPQPGATESPENLLDDAPAPYRPPSQDSVEPYRPAPAKDAPLYGAPQPRSSFRNAPVAAKILGITGLLLFFASVVGIGWLVASEFTRPPFAADFGSPAEGFGAIPILFGTAFVGFILMGIAGGLSNRRR